MSYILEALRQSEQARGRDRAPPSMALAPAPVPSRWGLVATLLATLALAVALYGAWRVSTVAVSVVPATASDAVASAPPQGALEPSSTPPPVPRRPLPEALEAVEPSDSSRTRPPGADPAPVAALPPELLRDIESFKRELESMSPAASVPER
ncbi:hypothetical protein MARPU_10460 [Marichromatium purpuratum 984]|uniref:Uncharacterized protein n=1 Tax=Marichromatium purpuratum 984 TaxID=765910 RepID=W0E8H4_MARPU|nr:hypothetical protein [Marichromatium purpuratum]AHF05534.1 hypothetical protein MARPU_10460 [Marichromatium purpuratum 984]